MRSRSTAPRPAPSVAKRVVRTALAGLALAGLAAVAACRSSPTPPPPGTQQGLVVDTETGAPMTFSILSSTVAHPGSVTMVPGVARSAFVVGGVGDLRQINAVSPSGASPFSAACDPASIDDSSGVLYSAGGCGNVSTVTAGRARTVVPNLTAPSALAVGPKGTVYVAQEGAAVRIAANKRTTVRVPGLEPYPSMDGSLLADGRYAVLDNDRLFLVNFDTGALSVIAPPGGTSFQAGGHGSMPGGDLRMVLDDSPDAKSIAGSGHDVVIADLDVKTETWTVRKLIREGQPDRARIFVRSLAYDAPSACTYFTDAELDQQSSVAGEFVYASCGS